MEDQIVIEKPLAGVAVVTLNRPERRNALSIALMDNLLSCWNRLTEDGQTRVVVLRGSGPVFCAGLDLAEARDHSLVAESARCVEKTLHTLRFSPLVTIAALHGGAYAGGAGVVAACDMAVGTSDCQIGFPEARRGLLPALICDVLRTKLREGDLTELFLVGQPIGAARAMSVGLLQHVVDQDQLLSKTLELAKGVLAGGPQTIRDTKKLLHTAYGFSQNYQSVDQAAGMASSNDSHSEAPAVFSSIDEHLKARFSPEANEGLQAFIEKRPPSWTVM